MPPPIDNLRERIVRGVDYFNREYFFEAHDEFEELWMEARDAESRELFHGLVNVATGFYHYRMNNLAGMQSQLRKGVAKLDKLPHRCHGVAVEHLVHQVDPFLKSLATGMPLPKSLPNVVLDNEYPPPSTSKEI